MRISRATLAVAVAIAALALSACGHSPTSSVLPKPAQQTRKPMTTTCSHYPTLSGDVSSFIYTSQYGANPTTYQWSTYYPIQSAEPFGGYPPTDAGVWELLATDVNGNTVADSQPQSLYLTQGQTTTVTVSIPYGLCQLKTVQITNQENNYMGTAVLQTGQATDTIYVMGTPPPTPAPITFTETSGGYVSNHCEVNKFGQYVCTQSSSASAPYNVTWTVTQSKPTPAPTTEPTPRPCLRQPCPQ
jgi:hypothetical protein